MADQDFDEQMKQESLSRALSENEACQQTYTDSDGTVYEWDLDKGAWFPKIDNDFIAQYQMNYGVETSTADQEAQQEMTAEEYEKYCQDYYKNYYNTQQGSQDATTAPNSEMSATNSSTLTADAINAEASSQPISVMRSHSTEGTMESHEDHYFEQYYDEHFFTDPEARLDTEDQIVTKNTEAAVEGDNADENDKKTNPGEKRKQEPAVWFEMEDGKSTNVYVSGLPLDVTDEEFVEHMSKCGMVMFDSGTKNPKVKLYRDENGQPKGDGLCCYIKSESVDLALQILDGSNVRSNKIHVEMAKFTMKGAFDPKKRKRVSNKDKRKIKERQEKLFDWRPDLTDNARLKCEKTVILKHMFDPKEFETNPLAINEVRDDVRAECSKFGDVQKIQLFDRQPDGVISVAFKNHEAADSCITALNGRWFAQKQISAVKWDGKEKFEVEETEEEREKRLDTWVNFLEAKDGGSEKKSTSNVNTEPAVNADRESNAELPRISENDNVMSNESVNIDAAGASQTRESVVPGEKEKVSGASGEVND